MPTNENTGFVDLNKSADILQATFKHYYDMAMDHHTKAATTSNILLIIVGAIITLITYRNDVSGANFGVGGAAVFVIGLFGAVWVWKQHERYHYWENIAKEYQKELTIIVPMLKTTDDYQEDAKKATLEDFSSLFAETIKDRYLWVSLHIIIATIGVGLMLVWFLPALYNTTLRLLSGISG